MTQDKPTIKLTVPTGWYQLDDFYPRTSVNETNRLLATSTADASALISSIAGEPPTERLHTRGKSTRGAWLLHPDCPHNRMRQSSLMNSGRHR